MALTWDMTEVKARELVEHHVSEAVIWHSMICGWGWQLTEKNVAKAWDRISFYQRLHGGIMQGPQGNIPLTRDEVYSMVGLRTNVSPITDAQFLKAMYREHAEKNARVLRADERRREVKPAPAVTSSPSLIRSIATTDEARAEAADALAEAVGTLIRRVDVCCEEEAPADHASPELEYARAALRRYREELRADQAAWRDSDAYNGR